MRRREDADVGMAAALEAYRAAACAEADAHFDDHALEAQRVRILQRLDLSHKARVLPFPGAPAATRPVSTVSRRWISAAAVAGLLIGLVTGQLLHVLPGDSVVNRQTAVRPSSLEPRTSPVAARVSAPVVDPDNALLDAIDLAVSRGGASELRALHDLTFAYEPY
ncbi:MAG: hypothetical protein R2712_29180 [Vicinamibacterales bacterium]